MINTFPIYFLEENIQKISINLICSKLRIIFIVIVLPSATSSITEGQWFSLGTLISSTNKTDRWNIVESGVKHHNPNTTKSRDSEQTSFCARYSEQSLNVTEHCWKFWTESEHCWKFWTDSEHYWKFWTLLNIAENSEHCWKFWTDSEH